MAAIDFPDTPTIGDEFTVGDRTWRWTGVVWETLTTTTAVGPQGEQGEPGLDGEDGDSAYQVAVNNGFVGNEQAWLDSLVGPTGPTGATGATGGFESTQTIVDLSTNYVLLAADKGKLFTNSAAVTVTVGGIGIGEQVDFLQTDSNQITFTADVGATLNSKDGNVKTAVQGSAASVKCISSGVYWLIGDLGV